MKFIELFAGIGGFRLGLEKSSHEAVWANEWLEKPASIYECNFKEKPDGRDIRTIDPATIPHHDLLTGGFPCATFSVAGKRTGFSSEDTRGSLFFEICRFLRINRTPYFLLENVKGLLNHDGGRTFQIILISLDELGYDIQWQLCNSKNYGVPQSRERIFIVGNLRGKPRPKVFPLRETNPTYGGDEQEEQEGAESVETVQWRRNHLREFADKKTCHTLTANMGTGGNNVPLVRKRKTAEDKDTPFIQPTEDGFLLKEATKKGYSQEACVGDGVNSVVVRAVITPDRTHKRQNGRRFKEHNEPAFTLGAQDRHGVQVGSGIRKLTPVECERLQGLPDDFTKYYADGKLVSNSERYERCGRTVTTSVIEAIGRGLHEFY